MSQFFLRAYMGSLVRAIAVLLWAVLPAPVFAGTSPAPEAREAAPTSPEPDGGDIGRVAGALGRRLSAHTTDHFVLLYATDRSWIERAGRMLERTHERFYQSFETAGFHPQPLRGRLTWVVFNRHEEFDAYAREADHMDISYLDGYYSARTNRVAVVRRGDATAPQTVNAAGPHAGTRLLLSGFLNDSGHAQADGSPEEALDMERAMHEAAHQLAFNSGLQKRGVMYPLWVSEGMAMHFETERPATADAAPKGVGRRQALLKAEARGHLLPLAEFLTMTRVPTEEDGLTSSEAYAEAWGVFRFLFEQRGSALKRYLAALARLPGGWRDEDVIRREIVAAFGSIARLQESWTEFLGDIAAPPPHTLPCPAGVSDIVSLRADTH